MLLCLYFGEKYRVNMIFAHTKALQTVLLPYLWEELHQKKDAIPSLPIPACGRNVIKISDLKRPEGTDGCVHISLKGGIGTVKGLLQKMATWENSCGNRRQ